MNNIALLESRIYPLSKFLLYLLMINKINHCSNESFEKYSIKDIMNFINICFIVKHVFQFTKVNLISNG